MGTGVRGLGAHGPLPGWTHGRVRPHPSSRPIRNAYVRLAWQSLRARLGAPTRATRLQESGLRGYWRTWSGGARITARVAAHTSAWGGHHHTGHFAARGPAPRHPAPHAAPDSTLAPATGTWAMLWEESHRPSASVSMRRGCSTGFAVGLGCGYTPAPVRGPSVAAAGAARPALPPHIAHMLCPDTAA